MEKYDIPINFCVMGKSENDAIYSLQRFLHDAIITLSMENEILEHDLIEYLPETDPEGNNL